MNETEVSISNSPDNPFFQKQIEGYNYIDVEAQSPFAKSIVTPVKVKRGLGRPRKKMVATLEEDLQFSSREESDVVILYELEGSKTGILLFADIPNDPRNVAETMVVREYRF